MLVSIVPIGNSKGIRIPKNILKQLCIEDQVEMEVHEHELLIKPVESKPRKGWAEAFKTMHENGDDSLIIADQLDLESFKWEW